MVELFEAALEQIMNERISTMFAQGFIFTRSPQQDGEMAVSSVRGDIVVDYSAEMKTDETTVNFAAFTTFLQKYLPLFPDSAFNPRAVSANYERFLGERGNFLFVMTRFQQANQFLLERLGRQDPRLNLDMLKASDTIATLLNAICSHGFI